MNKANWKVQDHTFLTHIRHDIAKGVDNTVWKWQNISIEKRGNELLVMQGFNTIGKYPVSALGTEERHSEDNTIFNNINLTGLATSAKMSQELTNGTNATNTKSENKMNTNTNAVVNNVTSTIKTVGQQIASSAIISAKMEAGENILLALRNIVTQKAGFMQKVKFKFAPVLLDTAVTLAADILVAELMPEKKTAKLAVECLNLAMTKEIISELPLKEFTTL